jgi:hypothetical protein
MSLVVYLAAVVFGLSCVVLLRRPVTAVRDPLTVSTCVAIVLGSLVFVCSAPLTLAAVNDLTGVPNFGAPLTYGMLSAYSCSLIVLLINWRGGPRNRVRCLVLRAIAAYTLLVVALIVLFALADADTERLTDLDTYYAGTPFLREMILLYLAGHSAAMLVMCVMCVKWAREVTGLLRAGLRLILAGGLLDLVGFQAAKYTAVAARWAGHDLDFLSTSVAPPMASLGALICSAGFVLPRLLPAVLAHWRGLGDYRKLAPLWALLRFVSTAPKPPVSWWPSPPTSTTGCANGPGRRRCARAAARTRPGSSRRPRCSPTPPAGPPPARPRWTPRAATGCTPRRSPAPAGWSNSPRPWPGRPTPTPYVKVR